MKKRYLIDTNVFINILVKRDKAYFRDCTDLFEKIKKNKISAVTCGVILAELVWILKSFYGINKKTIVESLESITKMRGLIIVDRYRAEVAVKLFKEKPIKYIDALIGSIKEIESKKWVVVSYDKDFDKLGVKRMEPGDL